MEPLHRRKRIVRWGNGYGIRLTRKEMEALGLHEGDEASVALGPVPRKTDLSGIKPMHFGGIAEAHDDVLAQGYAAEAKGRASDARR